MEAAGASGQSCSQAAELQTGPCSQEAADASVESSAGQRLEDSATSAGGQAEEQDSAGVFAQGLRHRGGDGEQPVADAHMRAPDSETTLPAAAATAASSAAGVPLRARQPLPPGSTRAAAEGQSSVMSRRLLLSALSMLIVMAMSFLYAQQRAVSRAARRKMADGPPNPVPPLLDSEAVHHVEVAVANLSTSLRFYVGVLGGQEVDAGNKADASLVAAWQMLNLGNSQVLLAQVSSPASKLAAQPRLALRLSPSVSSRSLLQAVEERLRTFPDLKASVRCSEDLDETSGAEGGGGWRWRLASCHGPDGELIEFWRPTLQVAKALDRARKLWIAAASDNRGRDLFE